MWRIEYGERIKGAEPQWLPKIMIPFLGLSKYAFTKDVYYKGDLI
jgi:hypothetical protein